MSDEIPPLPPGMLLYRGRGGGGDWRNNLIAIGRQAEDGKWVVKYYHLCTRSAGFPPYNSYWEEHNNAHAKAGMLDDLMKGALGALLAEKDRWLAEGVAR